MSATNEHAPDNYDEEQAGAAAARIAALLGSQDEWDVENMEIIAEILHNHGFRHPGDSDNNAYYRHQQVLYGLRDETEDDDWNAVDQ